MVKRQTITYPAEQRPEIRTAYFYTPDTYDRNPDQKYPVLYMFDGHNVFFDTDATYGKSWGLQEYLDRISAQVIVAAIECSHAENHGRLREYAPFSFSTPETGKIEAHGKQTMDWMINTFKPMVDTSFRTLPGRETTWIAGSSMGGLMSLYALLAYNNTFSKAAALSPSLWTCSRDLQRMIRNSRPKEHTSLYIDYGSREFSSREDSQKLFETITRLLQKKVFVTSRIVPYGTHCEASWEKQLPFAIASLMYPFGANL